MVAEFESVYAPGLRPRQPQPSDKSYLDDVFVTINGRRHYCGGPSTRTATSSTSWSNPAGTPRAPSVSSVSL